jgi:hypothetical protein
MTDLFYQLLKKHQKYKGSETINTHRGFAPTTGSWLLKNYAENSSKRDWLYKALVFLQESGVQYAIVENIDYLSDNALTRVRVDLDVNLTTDDPSAFEPHLAAFIDCLYDILYEYTEVKPEADLAGMVVLLEKPRCTARDKGGFKHGAKLTLPYLVSTHTDMLKLRLLLLQQAHAWMPASWHGDTPVLDTDIIDPCVYKGNGWLMYGSQKQNQIHGGYRATRVWHRKAEVCPVADCDWTPLEMQRLLNIFCDHETDDDVHVLNWTKTPPEVQQHTSKRKTRPAACSESRRRISAPVLSILTEILANLGDSSSLLTHESTEADTYSYRVNRNGIAAPCANKLEHANNSGILQLTTLFGRPVIRYNCFSTKCGAGRDPVVIESPDLAKCWAEAEALECCKRAKTDNETDRCDDVPQDGDDVSDMPEEEEWYGDDVPDIPDMPDEEEWYGDCPDIPDMPEEEEPGWYGGDIPDMPEEEEPGWYGGDIPDMPADTPEPKTAIVDKNPPRSAEGFMGTLVGIANKFISCAIAMNGGKSYAAIQLAKVNSDWTIWFITARQSHAYALLQTVIAAGLDCAMYLKKDWIEKIHSRIKIVQYQSLYSKLERCPSPHMVVMDETKALADAIQCVPTNQGHLMNNWMLLKSIIATAQKVLYLDADMTHDGAAYALQDILYRHHRRATLERLMDDAEALQAFAAQGGEQQKILRREYPVSKFDMQRKVKMARGTQQWKLLVQDLTSGKRVLVVCGSVKEATVLSKRVAEFVTGDLGIGLYTSETPNKADLQNLTECWNRFQIIIISSTITIGLDYQPVLHRIYVMPHIMSFTAQQAWQGTGRCRTCFTGEIIVRWDGNDAQLRQLKRKEIDAKVTRQLQFYIERKGLVETRVANEKCTMCFTLEREVVQGQVNTVCGDLLTLMAHAKVERSYCHSESEWMTYFLYIARRKGMSISSLEKDNVEDDEEVAAEAEEALQAESVYRADNFDNMRVDHMPMYSVAELVGAEAALERFSPAELEAARAAETAESLRIQCLPPLERAERAQAFRKDNPALDALLTREEVREKAKSLNAILKFDKTGHGQAKDVFMQQQRESHGKFDEYELKLLCTKLLMTKMFPGTEITLQFVKQFERHRLAVTNQVRLMQDDGVVSVASSADFLNRVHISDRVDTMQHKHLILQEAERLVRLLGFTGLRDFTTAVPSSCITVGRVAEQMHVLHLLGISTAKVKPAGIAKANKKKQPKATTLISRALSAAVGLTLRSKRASGSKRRKSQEAETQYLLAVTGPVQDIMDKPSELVAEHWYRRKYKKEPPHLDGLYEGDVELTDELKTLMKKRQEEEEEDRRRLAALEARAAADELEAAANKPQYNSEAVVIQPIPWPVYTEQTRAEERMRSLELWNRICAARGSETV